MGDYHVRMRFDVEAAPEAVMRAITTEEGVRGWWSEGVSGAPGEVGGHLEVSFPDVPQPFELEVAHRDDRRVDWKVGGFPPWWAGTTIRWEVDRQEGPGSALLFSHRDFDPDNEIIPIITPAWAQIILRLKSLAETGKPDPFFRLG